MGEFKDEKRHGKGCLYYASGNSYNGDWVNNKREGKGVYQSKDGDLYEVYDSYWIYFQSRVFRNETLDYESPDMWIAIGTV